MVLSSLVTWGLRAQVAHTQTMMPIWKARVNWLLSPPHQAWSSSTGPLPMIRDRTNTTIIRMTQNTKESGMIFSAAKLNFLLMFHRGVPFSFLV